jgi:hypothetical protein
MKSRSLFILSLPRSLSSAVFNMSSMALGLHQPLWTSDGEILNSDRIDHAICGNARFPKYSHNDRNHADVNRMFDFLDQQVFPSGYVYKDVVQPFVITEWLRAKKFPVLIIERDVVDVAYSMLMRKWNYPSDVLANTEIDLLTGLVAGLKVAELELKKLNAERIHYNDLISNENSLHLALKNLYPRKSIPEISYINDRFIIYRDNIALRKETVVYKQLSSIHV